MILRDDHIHTDYSDGINTPSEMIREAVRLGYGGITFTDHVRVDSEWTDAYFEELSKLKEEYIGKIDIRIGVECKLIDHEGRIDCPAKVLDNPDILKIAAIHRIPDGEGGFISRSEISLNRQKAFECYINTARGVQNNSLICRLAHPFSLFDSMGIDRGDEKAWDSVKKMLLDIGVSIEYNNKYDNGIVPDEIWKVFCDRIIYGSDSHSVEDLHNRASELMEIQKEHRK